jgi:hypothetical protein
MRLVLASDAFLLMYSKRHTLTFRRRRKTMRKTLSIWGMIVLMLASVVGTAAAQSGTDPTAVPTSQPAEPTLYLHPIVQVLSAYFGRTTRPMMPTPTPTETATVDPSASPTPVTSETPTETPTAIPVMGPDEFAAQIAKYHEEGMGFGELVKLYAMAEASVEACVKQAAAATTTVADPTQPACEAVTVEQLVSEVQGGAGMGQLFKEYGKPALLGVGHVKKAMQNLEAQATPTPDPSMAASDLQTQNQKSANGKGNSNKPMKDKTPKPHGPNK